MDIAPVADMLAPFDFKGLNNNEAETCVFAVYDKKTWRGKHPYEVSLKNFHCNIKCLAQWNNINLLQIQRVQWEQKKKNCFSKFDWGFTYLEADGRKMAA